MLQQSFMQRSKGCCGSRTGTVLNRHNLYFNIYSWIPLAQFITLSTNPGIYRQGRCHQSSVLGWFLLPKGQLRHSIDMLTLSSVLLIPMPSSAASQTINPLKKGLVSHPVCNAPDTRGSLMGFPDVTAIKGLIT